MWRVAEIFEGATEHLVGLPVACETFNAAVMDVFAAGAELASRLVTDSTLVAGRCHGGAEAWSVETSVNCKL